MGNSNATIVYHGSERLFTSIDPSYIGEHANSEGKGFYFTNDVDIAKRYTNGIGYLYTVLFKGKKSLSSESISLTRDEVRRFIQTLDKEVDYLSNWGDIEYEGYENVLNNVVKCEMSNSDNDVDMIAGICNTSGDNAATLRALYETTGFDSIVLKADWRSDKREQILYIACIPEIIEIINVHSIRDLNRTA